jgi:hypothetical protein
MDLFHELGVFHEGHVIIQIHDYRMSIQNVPETRYAILRPTTRSLVADSRLLAEKYLKDSSDQCVLQIESCLLVSLVLEMICFGVE